MSQEMAQLANRFFIFFDGRHGKVVEIIFFWGPGVRYLGCFSDLYEK